MVKKKKAYIKEKKNSANDNWHFWETLNANVQDWQVNENMSTLNPK